MVIGMFSKRNNIGDDMKNYEKPIVLMNEELAEGVYAGSGDCYEFVAKVVQTPDSGIDYYVVQVDGWHHAADAHHSDSRTVVIEFNQVVNYVSSNAADVQGSGTTSLALTYTDGYMGGAYHNNSGHYNKEYIGLGNLNVKSDPGLAVLKAYSTYCSHTCADPGHLGNY